MKYLDWNFITVYMAIVAALKSVTDEGSLPKIAQYDQTISF